MSEAQAIPANRSDLTRMIVQQDYPFNAEPTPEALIRDYLTPQAIFYVRSHGDVPQLDNEHKIIIGEQAWTRAELEQSFPIRTVTATLQCAGNRRADLQAVAATNGDPWGVGAIGNAEWTGVSLIDVLRAASLSDGGGFVHFTAADEVAVEDERSYYGVSIAMDKACDPDVLLAWAMNGELLAPDHGAPVRLIVPGYAGVRSIKWLTNISVDDAPSTAPIQSRDYKLFPASVLSASDADWSKGLTINMLPVNAAICEPTDGAKLLGCGVTLRGYAMAYDRGVSRVEVSIDGGKTWDQATVGQGADERWGWTLWELWAELPPGWHEIFARAVDTAGQGQPEHARQVWNFAGYAASSWHRICIHIG